jgi:hypothetical protein
MITPYQYSDFIVGTFLFLIAYLIYKNILNKNENYYVQDILLTTFLFGCLIYFRYLLINYYILQSQNFSSHILLDD